MRNSLPSAKSSLGRACVAAVVLLFGLALLACQSQPAPAAPATKAPAPAPVAQATTAPAAPAAPTAAAPAAPAAPAATPAAAAPTETLKVGLMTPMSGSAARMAGIGERFTRMSIDDLNAKGGVKVGGKTYKLEAITVDDKNTADGGLQAANRLVLADKVKFMLSSWTTPLSGALATLDQNKILTIAITGTNDAVSKDHPTVFMTLASSPMRVAAVYDWLVKDKPNARRVAILSPDDANGRLTGQGSRDQVSARNLTLATQEYYPFDLKDYDPLITRVLRTNPDVIDVGMAGTQGSLLLAMMKSIHAQGFKGPVIAASADYGATKEGFSFMDGFTTPQLVDRNSPSVSKGEKELAEKYIAKYGEKEFEGLLIPAYNTPMVLAQVLEKTGTVDDTMKMAEALKTMEVETVFGKTRMVGAKTFGKPAVLEQPIYLSGVRDGKLVTFGSQLGTLP